MLKILKKPELYILLTLFMIRIILGNKIGVWYYSNQVYDDQLLAKYAMLKEHFLNPNVYSMVKTMGYPLFINIVYISKIKYSILLSIIWCIDSIIVYKTILTITNNKKISIFAFLYVLFMPMAFEAYLGTRMYRNSIIAPFSLLVICMMILSIRKCIFINTKKDILKFYIKSLIFGILFSFTYYIKEDGLWLLACLLLSLIVEIVIITIKFLKNKINKSKFIIIIVACILPIMIFSKITVAYKGINKKYFGVYEIETRNSGELGKFVSNVYKIESSNRNSVIWAPKDSIQQAFSVSSTLKKFPELEYDILHSDWCRGDIDLVPIKGDFLTWVLRTSLEKQGIWKSEKQINELFKNVNFEIEIAFKNGKLRKENRIQLLSSAGGRNPHEILQLRKLIYLGFKETILLESYIPGTINMPTYDMETTQNISKLTYENNLNGTLTNKQKKSNWYVEKIVNNIFSIYRFINIVLFMLLFFVILSKTIAYAKKIMKRIKINRNELFEYCLILIITLISVMYVFSISWFDEFIFADGINKVIVNFYLAALPVLLVLPYMLSLNICGIFLKGVLKKCKTKIIRK